MYLNVMDIADYIIEHERRFHRPISYLRLEKLLYFVQVLHLMKLKTPCFLDNMTAETYGPRIKRIEAKYQSFGLNDIPVNKKRKPLPILTEDIVDDMLMMCKQYGNLDLLAIIVEQKPYQQALLTDEKIITIQSIMEYFCM